MRNNEASALPALQPLQVSNCPRCCYPRTPKLTARTKAQRVVRAPIKSGWQRPPPNVIFPRHAS